LTGGLPAADRGRLRCDPLARREDQPRCPSGTRPAAATACAAS